MNDLLKEVEVPVIVDFLLQHGIISQSIAEQVISIGTRLDQMHFLLLAIPSEPSSSQQSQMVSNCSSSSGYQLLISALRHNGYHQLANRLDNNRRIRPAMQRSSFYTNPQFHSLARRRGQIAVVLQLSSIQVAVNYFTHPSSPMLNNNNVEVHLKWIADKKGDFSNNEIVDSEENHSESSCLFSIISALFCRLIKKRSNHQQIINEPQSYISFSEVLQQEPKSYSVDKSSNNFLSDSEILEKASALIYSLLGSEDCRLHTELVKFIEQKCGLLFLDCFYDLEAFTFLVICTELNLVSFLRERVDNGWLSESLEQLLMHALSTNSDFTEFCTTVKGLKLAVGIDEGDCMKSYKELVDG